MKSQNDINIVALINEEIKSAFIQQRDYLLKDAKQQISKVQDDNRRTYNLRRKQAQKFQLHGHQTNSVWPWSKTQTQISRTLQSHQAQTK
ncbi:hypothetical protein X975_19872, partial [Stegodyphus mimosarum]